MGNPLKRRSARTLHMRLSVAKQSIDRVFGDYDPGDDTYAADVQRALENALGKTEALIGHLTPKPVIADKQTGAKP